MRLSAVKSFSEVIAKLFFAAGISQFLLQKRRGAKLTLLYHNPRPEIFNAHLEFLKKHYALLPLADANAADGASVSITFDDGYRNNYLQIYPILKKYGVPAAIFVPTGYLGQFFYLEAVRIALQKTKIKKLNLPWDSKSIILGSASAALDAWQIISKKLAVQPPSERDRAARQIISILGIGENQLSDAMVCTKKELRTMLPLIELGSHTVTHPNLAFSAVESAKSEITASKSAIESISGKECAFFAYPFGTAKDFSEESRKMVRSAGYGQAFTAINPFGEKRDPWRTGRIGVGNSDSVELLCLKLSSVWPILTFFGGT
ncbi:MAG TPA: polysaccharide deacetylase family protein [archaeon]|nr:polysaccharide deacetylase family protein [archaeon]